MCDPSKAETHLTERSFAAWLSFEKSRAACHGKKVLAEDDRWSDFCRQGYCQINAADFGHQVFPVVINKVKNIKY